jgi:hypothetical protein
MKNLKIRFLLPIAVFMMAVFAAFATQSSVSTENLAWEQGYIHTATSCDVANRCSTSGTKVCKVNGQQLFGMDGSQCIKTLYLPFQAN